MESFCSLKLEFLQLRQHYISQHFTWNPLKPQLGKLEGSRDYTKDKVWSDARAAQPNESETGIQIANPRLPVSNVVL